MLAVCSSGTVSSFFSSCDCLSLCVPATGCVPPPSFCECDNACARLFRCDCPHTGVLPPCCCVCCVGSKLISESFIALGVPSPSGSHPSISIMLMSSCDMLCFIPQGASIIDIWLIRIACDARQKPCDAPPGQPPLLSKLSLCDGGKEPQSPCGGCAGSWFRFSCCCICA